LKYIITSDIHGNVESLLALIKEISEAKNTTGRLLIAGDIVGYGASPNECCDIVRYLIYGRRKVKEEKIYSILNNVCSEPSIRDTLIHGITSLGKKCVAIGGNHDKEAIGEPSLTSEMNPIAQSAADWTKKVLTKENHNFLQHLPLRKKFRREKFEIVHSTPAYPQGYEYAKNASILKYNSLRSKITFGGHTHRPAAYLYTKETRMVNATVFIPTDNYDMRLMLIERQTADKIESFTIESNDNWRYYINVGSLGQPRDGNPHGSYVVFDSLSKEVSFKRIPYDTESAAKKIKEANLPGQLAERVLKGV